MSPTSVLSEFDKKSKCDYIDRRPTEKSRFLNILRTLHFVILISFGIYWSLRQIIRSNSSNLGTASLFHPFVFKTRHRLNGFPPVPDQKLVLYFFIRMFKEMLLFCLIYAKPRTISYSLHFQPCPRGRWWSVSKNNFFEFRSRLLSCSSPFPQWDIKGWLV